jgi:CheY-like chemotaxis protein
MLAGISILVLEDDPDTLDLYAGTLRKLGAEVCAAKTALDALDIAARWRPDAALCDLHLAGIDGYGFLAQLRQIPGRRFVPVIAVSASHPAVERDKSLAAGFAEYVVKPARMADVIAAITKVIATATERAPLPLETA